MGFVKSWWHFLGYQQRPQGMGRQDRDMEGGLGSVTALEMRQWYFYFPFSFWSWKRDCIFCFAFPNRLSFIHGLTSLVFVLVRGS